jgi:hypothetical protein
MHTVAHATGNTCTVQSTTWTGESPHARTGASGRLLTLKDTCTCPPTHTQTHTRASDNTHALTMHANTHMHTHAHTHTDTHTDTHISGDVALCRPPSHRPSSCPFCPCCGRLFTPTSRLPQRHSHTPHKRSALSAASPSHYRPGRRRCPQSHQRQSISDLTLFVCGLSSRSHYSTAFLSVHVGGKSQENVAVSNMALVKRHPHGSAAYSWILIWQRSPGNLARQKQCADWLYTWLPCSHPSRASAHSRR